MTLSVRNRRVTDQVRFLFIHQHVTSMSTVVRAYPVTVMCTCCICDTVSTKEGSYLNIHRPHIRQLVIRYRHIGLIVETHLLIFSWCSHHTVEHKSVHHKDQRRRVWSRHHVCARLSVPTTNSLIPRPLLFLSMFLQVEMTNEVHYKSIRRGS